MFKAKDLDEEAQMKSNQIKRDEEMNSLIARKKRWRKAKNTIAVPGRMLRGSLSQVALAFPVPGSPLAPAEPWVRKGAIDRLARRTLALVDSFPKEDQTAVFNRDKNGDLSFKCCRGSWQRALFTEQFFHMEQELLGDEHTRQLYSCIANKHVENTLIPERSLFKSEQQKFAYTYHLFEKLTERSLGSFVESQCGVMKDTDLMMSWNVGFWMSRDKHWFLDDLTEEYQAQYRADMDRTDMPMNTLTDLTRCFDSTITRLPSGFVYEKAPPIDGLLISSLNESQASITNANAARLREIAIARWLAPISFDMGEGRYGDIPSVFSEQDKEHRTSWETDFVNDFAVSSVDGVGYDSIGRTTRTPEDHTIQWVHFPGSETPEDTATIDRLYPVMRVDDPRFGNKDFLAVNRTGRRPKGQLSMVNYYRQCAMDHHHIVNQNYKQTELTACKPAKLKKYMSDYWNGRNTAAGVGLELGWIAELQNPTSAERRQLKRAVMEAFAQNRAALVEAGHAPAAINSELQTMMAKELGKKSTIFIPKDSPLKLVIAHAKLDLMKPGVKFVNSMEISNALLVTLPGYKESLYPDLSWSEYASCVWEPAVHALFRKNLTSMMPPCWNYVVKNHPLFMKPSLRWVLPVIFLADRQEVWEQFVADTKKGLTYLDWPRWALHHYHREDSYRNQLSAAERSSIEKMLYQEEGDQVRLSERLNRSLQVNGESGFLHVDWQNGSFETFDNDKVVKTLHVRRVGLQRYLEKERAFPLESHFYPPGDSADDLLNATNAGRVLNFSVEGWPKPGKAAGTGWRQRKSQRARGPPDSDSEFDGEEATSSTPRPSSKRRCSKRLKKAPRSAIPQTDDELDED